MKRILFLVFLASACGRDGDDLIPLPDGRRVVVVDPQPKTLEVGTRGDYVLDPALSSNLVRAGEMRLEVVARDEKFTTIGGGATVETVVGRKSFDMNRNIENDFLSAKFMAELRAKGAKQATEFYLNYVGLTPEGCDVLRLTKIKDMPDAVLEPTICIAARTMPMVKVVAKEGGVTVAVVFKSL